MRSTSPGFAAASALARASGPGYTSTIAWGLTEVPDALADAGRRSEEADKRPRAMVWPVFSHGIDPILAPRPLARPAPTKARGAGRPAPLARFDPAVTARSGYRSSTAWPVR